MEILFTIYSIYLRLVSRIILKLASTVFVKVLLWGVISIWNYGQPTFANFTRELICNLALYPSGLNINWNCAEQRNDFIRKGRYVPRNILPTRFLMYQEKVLILTPRLRCGVPFSLGVMNVHEYCRAEPLINPYPNWDMHAFDDPEKIQNAIDIELDSNNFLWILDVGIVNTLSIPIPVSQPRVIAICSETGKVVKTVNLGPLACNRSRFQYIQVEVNDLGNTYLYIADGGTNSIIVWDVSAAIGFKVALPDNILGPAKGDVLYATLIKSKCEGNILYITYLSAKAMYRIRTCLFRSGNADGVIDYVGNKPGNIVILGTDNGFTIFFRKKGETDLFMWDTTTEFHPRNFVVAEIKSSGRYTSHVAPGYKRLMWALDSNFPDYLRGEQGSMGVNAKLHPLIKFCDE